MANILRDSIMNVVKFHALDPIQPEQYISRFMDDWRFNATIHEWEQKVCYIHPWGQDDPIRLQYESNFNPIEFDLINQEGQTVNSFQADTMLQNELDPTFFLRQVEIDLQPYSPGYYVLRRRAAGQIHYSEPFEIQENPENTLFLEFSHYETYQGIRFFVPFSPALRVPAILKYAAPGAEDTAYDDQRFNRTMVYSRPYRVWKFILGGQNGVPPWLIDKVSRIFGCSDLKIDGRLYTKQDGAQWEPVELENYPMAGWSIELREKLNREHVISENDTVIVGKAAMMAVMDSKGFGLSDNGNDFIEIVNIE